MSERTTSTPSTTKTPTGAEQSRSRTVRLITVSLGILVVAVVGILAQTSQQTVSQPHTSAATPAATPTTTTSQGPRAQLVRRDPNDPAAAGPVDAPVVLIEYADFTCKYCAAFAEQTLPALLAQYVEQGKLRIEWRDAPVLSQHSVNAALAARAAARQNLFWQYYEALYARTFAGNSDWSRKELINIAASIDKLDVPAFTKALDDPAVAQFVEKEAQTSAALGVTGTPTFVLGEEVVNGAQPIEVFRQLIDAQLAEAGKG
ncbi:thioredoxin domain-containing protein [Sphaerisporangium sp. NPDC051011]|uniref:DsbA family protein n=1 Tax=Sphaerisporangium sp. NPDC051011 TaxID=3155792 RepID=UPI00340B127A